jgi:DNA invertase Pin-like site-specific DNA recombinase
VIDEDLGLSGRPADARLGFQRLLAEVSMDHVGLVLDLEMSRLSRSSRDWHHLLEVCGLFGALLADQDGLYDPSDPNDRLVLGLKGQLSEMELHMIRCRLERGKLYKARRGELITNAPIGYVKTPAGGLALDPDDQVRAVVRLVFDKFDELGAAHAVTRYLRENDIRVGIRTHDGPNRGNLEWRPARVSTVCRILAHPGYAGTYTYGRTPIEPRRRRRDGQPGIRHAPMADWAVILHDRCPPTSPGSTTSATGRGSARIARRPRPEARHVRASPCSPGWCSAAVADGGRACSTATPHGRGMSASRTSNPARRGPVLGSVPWPWMPPSPSRSCGR